MSNLNLNIVGNRRNICIDAEKSALMDSILHDDTDVG